LCNFSAILDDDAVKAISDALASQISCRSNSLTLAVFDYMSDDSNFDVVPEDPANGPQALHRALYDNSLTTGWEPQHRIQFYHSKYDMIVPYGNYLAFRDAHPQGEGTMYL
jgi:hypothetical protein